MNKLFYFVQVFLLLFIAIATANAQSNVLDPNDKDSVFTASFHPAAPPFGQISKWGHTNRLDWSPYANGYKSYYFKGMAFRLKFPKSYQAAVKDGKKYPMLLFLHGLGEYGSIYDNELQLLHGGQLHAQAVDNSTFDGFLVYPQSNSGFLQGYFGSMTDLIDSMVKYVKVDLDRVIVSGLSSGGQATWDMLQTSYNDKYFASAAPISAAQIEDTPYFPLHITIPIWMSNGGLDNDPDPQTATTIYNSFKNLGGNIMKTLYPDLGHGVWYNFWAEPGYFPFLNAAHKANPLVYYQRNQFCPGDAVNVNLGLQAGFYSYEWQKDGVTIPGATSNILNVTSYGTYTARFKRTSTSTFSVWSPIPVVVSQKQPTVTPPISINGLYSVVLPSLDGSTTVPLSVPNIYASYEWRRVSDNALVSSTNTYNAPVGQYKVQVTEQYGCSSSFSSIFSVIAANGTNVPDKATNLTASTISNNSIQLNWFNNPTPLYNESGFEIYRSTISGSNYKLINITGADILSYIDTLLQPNTKYYYAIRAVNANGAAPVSVEATATTSADIIPPSAPDLLTVSGTSRNSVSLLWNPSKDDVGVDKYDIYVNGKKSYSTSETNYTVYNLDSLTTYSFYVKARDISGNVSAASNQVSAVTKFAGLNYKYYEGSWSVLPDFNSLTPVKTGNTPNVDISVSNKEDNFGFLWEGYIRIPVTGTYKFETNSDDGSKLYLSTYSANATALVNNDGLHGAQYAAGSIKLTAGTYPISITFFENTGGQSMQVYWTCAAAGFSTRTLIPDAYFGDNPAAAGTAPVVPTTLVATATAYNKISLTWKDKSTNETGFEIYRKLSTDANYMIISTTAANVTSYIDSSVLPSKTYNYKILSVNNYGSSGYTAVASATTAALPAAPAAPSTLAGIVISSSKISLSWKDNSSNETGFEIWRSISTNTSYLLLKKLGANATSTVSYQDTGLYANVKYYYHVRAVGIGGYSAYSNEVNYTTSNSIPTITAIPNVTMRFSSSKTISLSANDSDGDPITFSVTNLPSFASLTNTGYGTANITFNAGTTQATYSNIKVTASDNHGGSVSSTFTLVVNSNYAPTIVPVSNITVAEGSTVITNFAANDQDGNTGLVWTLTNVPSFITLVGSNGTGALTSKPNYANAGSYQVTITVTDPSGASVSTNTVVTVTDVAPPSEKVYVNILNSGAAPAAPWNNVTGVSSGNFLNSNNQSTTIGLQFLTSAWNTYDQGAVTGNNSGVYPDNVIRDYYYFGIYGAPNTVDFNITGLNSAAKYNVTLFGSSAYTGAGDNGSTVYSFNGTSKSLYVQNNQINTVSFSSISPDASGNILISMSKAAGAPVGYLNALVIDKPFDDGTVPVLPTNLSAEVLSNGYVKLHWSDLAYNESSYIVSRSTSANGTYTALNTGATNANDTTYTDNTVASRTTYFYKIEATNNYGTSGKTTFVSATTVNKAPVLNTLSSVFVKTSSTSTVNINATDDAGEVLTVTFTNLPSFAVYTSTGNGTGTITFTPGANDLGLYKGVTVTVVDNYGGTTTSSFDVNVADNSTRSVYVNFGAEGSPAQPAPWNNYLAFPFANLVIGNLSDDANVNTGFTFKFLQNWTGNLTLGMITGDDSGIYPDNVINNSVYTSSTSANVLEFGGLSTTKKYNVVFFSSIDAGGDASATFTSGSQSVTLNGRYNSIKSVQLNGLTANASGVIDISVTKASAAQYLNLNAMVIQEYDNTTPVIRPVDLFVESDLANNRAKLTWSDRSYNETGFEIARATSLTGTYTTVATVAANTTTYTNTGLSSNIRYYYKVRATSAAGSSAYSNINSIVLSARIVYINLDVNYHAPSPWNSTDAPPVLGATFSNLTNDALANTGFEMTITKAFNGEFYAGITGGGIFPDNVQQSNYWTDAGQTSELKLDNLDQGKKYRIGLFGSANWSSNFIANYTVNGGKTAPLNSYQNNSKVVYFDNVVPNSNGEIYIDIATGIGSPYSFTGAVTIEYYTDPTSGGTGNRPAEDAQPLITAAPASVNADNYVEVARPAAIKIADTKAFPNPFIDKISVQLGLKEKANSVSLMIFDANSNLVYSKNLSKVEAGYQSQLIDINMSKALPAGNYTLKVVSDGVLSNITKLVKAR